ncbi:MULTISPECIES: alanine--tRNA ligase [unclassified Sedimentibacter]|uniref:alanine--tRNA ligase n=1 Tax=unclassified Sedimentibacter TaxID=2649220 RepID=UPI0027E0C235|nr:alanine--tRNA ligase [Sedimentibacter sp. MB35-C1]WMJ75841.1 alanine--tRNA ligase [Sedimentibacter sp. MB35-C1]
MDTLDRFSINNIRREYLNFFKSKGHLTESSFSLIPKNDKSLLLIGAGMAPLKKYFTGIETPPCKRMATVQKCVRTGDIDNVGLTARHLTFFEMLGNFSFGDYFKKEAIQWAWELLTGVLKIEKDRLWVTVYLDDDEAADIWHDVVGVPKEKIIRLGKEDNFWELEVGPSGPCSEIYYDTGSDRGCGSPECKPGCDCNRFIEIWNLVFTQFDKDVNGVYHPLPNPNIDTGMGLERVAAVLQDKETVFDVEPLLSIVNKISEISGIQYGSDEKNDVSMKIICDHSRAAAFMIGDGVIPSNEGRGYVLRRLIRRAVRQGKSLGIHNEFLTKTVKVVIDEWKDAYPELGEKESYILKVIKLEEEKFKITIDQGLELLMKEIKALKEAGKDILDAGVAFKLYDTYGFPSELTEEILAENSIKFDKDALSAIMDEHRQMAREARAKTGSSGWKDEDFNLDVPKTEFTGYITLDDTAEVKAIVVDGEQVNTISEGQFGIIVLDKTPFYAESGGQTGDTGRIESDDAMTEVHDTKKYNKTIYLHEVTVVSGSISVSDKVAAHVNADGRKNTAKNHTCTHILHKVLKEMLGDHVNQAGSYVSQDRLRFDYTHFEAVDHDTLKEIEKRVNEAILADYAVNTDILNIEEAKKSGAMALFDEKYDDTVRVVSVGNFSKELCGGTHIDETAKIGLFKILSEGGIASGVRRIEAITGRAALNYLKELSDITDELSLSMKASKDELIGKVNTLKKEIKDKEKEIQKLNTELLKQDLNKMLEDYDEINGIKLFALKFKDKDANTLREIADKIKDKNESCAVLLASDLGDKVLFVAAVTKDLVKKGLNAGNMVREAAKVAGGGGGGRPDFAQAGGKNPGKADEAIEAVKKMINL